MDIMIKAELNKIVSSHIFQNCKRRSQLLKYLVDQKITNPDKDIKEITIAMDFYGFTADFDPCENSIIRNEIYRLKKNLKSYYSINKNTLFIISISNRNFMPKIEYKLKNCKCMICNKYTQSINQITNILISPPIKNTFYDMYLLVYNTITSEILRNKSYRLISFINQNLLNNFLSNNYKFLESKQKHNLFLDVTIIILDSIYNIYISIEDINQKEKIWKSKLMYKSYEFNNEKCVAELISLISHFFVQYTM